MNQVCFNPKQVGVGYMNPLHLLPLQRFHHNHPIFVVGTNQYSFSLSQFGVDYALLCSHRQRFFVAVTLGKINPMQLVL